MTVKELSGLCGWKHLAGPEGEAAPVSGCQAGDLLSWVMTKAKPGQVWLTVMGNVNTVAVSVATGISAIVVCGDAPLDTDAAIKAREHGMPVYGCAENLYEAAVGVYEALK